MKLLFLDTETTGVRASSDQIIEIGGVICDLDIVSFEITEIKEFESTVSLRQVMDEKITRITGITTEELAFAPKQNEVQEKWASWLEPDIFQIDAVIGHSINFDLDFLKNESWLLPEKLKIIDTLDLVRIFYPELQAINLEFLSEKLNLVDFQTSSSYHRSLFDTKACIRLFKNILLKIKNFPVDSEFIDYLSKELLPLNLQFYTSNNLAQTIAKKDGLFTMQDTFPLHLEEPQEVENIKEISLSGKEMQPGLSQVLNELGFLPYQKKLLEMLQWELPKNFSVILAQFYFINLVKILTPKKHLKFHTKEINVDILFGELVLKVLGFNGEKVLINPENSYVLNRFEKIIWQINSLTEQNLDLGKFVELVSFYYKIAALQEDFYPKEYLQKVQLFLSGYDFFLMSLQPFLEKTNYTYNYYNLANEERSLVSKIEKINLEISNLKLLFGNVSQDANELLGLIRTEILHQLPGIDLNSKQKLVFSLQRNSLNVSKAKAGFDLVSHLSKLEEDFGNLKINTNLIPEDFESLLDLLEITKFKADSYFTSQEFENFDKLDLTTFFQDKIQLSKTSGKPVLILAGQNSTIKDAKKTLTQTQQVTDYLILGETGSLTKIGSKLVRNFLGVAVLKVGSFDFLLNLKDIPEFSEIWIINSPYLFFQEFWLTRSKNSSSREGYVLELKRLYLQSILNFIYLKTSVKAKFLRSY